MTVPEASGRRSSGGRSDRGTEASTGDPAGEGADLLEVVERRIRELTSHPDPAVRDGVEELMAAFDMVHRTGLTNLVGGIQSMAGEAFLNRLTADVAVRLLLMSYGLIHVDRKIQADEALDTVRGHLSAHGISVDLLDVVGGVVYVRLGGVEASGASESDVRRDVEAALRRELLGFQELEVGPRSAGEGPLVQLGRSPGRVPTYADAGPLDRLNPGQAVAATVEGVPILLVRLAEGGAPGDDLRAFRNQCGESPLPLDLGTVDGAVLRCPWHGCEYDLRTGKRVDVSDAPPLSMLPVRADGSTVQVALGTRPASAE